MVMLAPLAAFAQTGNSAASPEASDAERRENLVTLLTIEQSISVCSFPISVKGRAAIGEARDALAKRLRQGASDINVLRGRVTKRLEQRKADMCNPRGEWRLAYDEAVKAYETER